MKNKFKSDDINHTECQMGNSFHSEAIHAFDEQMVADGFFVSKIEADGEWHRFFQRGGHKNNFDATYSLKINGEFATGCYYSYRNKDEKFHFQHGKDLTFIQRYGAYLGANPNHPYLVNKKIPPEGFRQTSDERLAIPMCDQTGQCCGLQLISPDGSKKFAPGSIKKGSRLEIQGESDTIYISEGIATGFSVYLATGKKTICAWDAGNLKDVGIFIHETYPNSRIIFAADNDCEGKVNVGVESAKKAAAAIGADVVIPEMAGGRKCDWNDIHVKLGIDEVTRQLAAATAEQKIQRFQFEDLTGWQTEPPPPIEYIYKNFLARFNVGVLCAQGGTGKSYLLEALTIAGIMGLECFKLFRPERPLRIIGLFVEDPRLITRTRMYDIGQTFLCNGLIRNDLQDAMNDNLRLFCDNIGPLARYDGKSNPEPTDAFKWLSDQVGNFDPDLIILDPKAQLYGLDENNNDHNTWWVNLLKGLNTYGASTLFAHHTPKNVSAFSLNGLRGGAGLGDACRWGMGMQHLDPDKAKELGVEPAGYVHARMLKNSYAPLNNDDFYFQRGDGGELCRVDLKSNQFKDAGFMLVEEIKSHLENGGNGLTIRDVVKDKSGKEIRDNLKERYPKITRDKIESLIQSQIMIKNLKLIIEKRGTQTVETICPFSLDNHDPDNRTETDNRDELDSRLKPDNAPCPA